MAITAAQRTRLEAAGQTIVNVDRDGIGCCWHADENKVFIPRTTAEEVDHIASHIEAVQGATTPPTSQDYIDAVASALSAANAAEIKALAEADDGDTVGVISDWRLNPDDQPKAVKDLTAQVAEL